MAHLVETMVSANSVIPWHKKGAVLSGYPSIDEMYKHSGLDWSVDLRPLYYLGVDGAVDTPLYALVRDSDNTYLGSCTERYTPLQNKDAFEWCKPLMASGLWVMETAGSLCNGKVCWALLNQGSTSVVKGDDLKNYLLLQWGHTGHDSVRCGLTSIRVVCNNTLQQALNRDGGTISSLQHNSRLTVKLDELRDLYDKTREEFKQQEEIFKKFSEKSVDKSEREQYIEELLATYVPEPVGLQLEGAELNKVMDRWRKRLDVAREQINLYISDGSGQRDLGISGNLWGVFNGVEEWIEKCQGGKRIQDRGYNILHGQGMNYVDLAFNNAMAMLN